MNLRKLLLGESTRLAHVKRYSTCQVIHRESTAEHTWFVSFYALAIGTYLNQQGVEINMAELMAKATIHDFEEGRTGDIFRPFKKADPELNELLHRQARKELCKMVDELDLGPKVSAEIVGLWDNSKDESPEGAIVEFCDFLSALSYMLRELKCANMTMHDHFETMKKYANDFNSTKFNFIRKLVDEAQQLCWENLTVRERNV